MANNVYANGRELACKAGSGKTICAFPDTCFTPPENPATPPGVPVPYPNTGYDSDTTKGSKNVKISDKEIMLKNKSYFKTSMGDEAGCAAKKGVITSKNKGKVYFKAWSMDVKVEGENVDRHLDLTTNNHACEPGDTPPWIFTKRVSLAGEMQECKDERKALKDNKCNTKKDGKVKCPDATNLNRAKKLHKAAKQAQEAAEKAGDMASAARFKKNAGRHQKTINKQNMEYEKACRRSPCNKAAVCMLVTYEDGNNGGCCAPQTPHHLVFDAAVKGTGTYEHAKGPCICAAGNASNGIHGLLHGKQKQWMIDSPPKGSTDIASKKTTVGKWESAAAKTVNEIHPQCSAACIKAQLRKSHQRQGVPAETEVNMVSAGASTDAVSALQKAWSTYR